jgi:hypothetical protein
MSAMEVASESSALDWSSEDPYCYAYRLSYYCFDRWGQDGLAQVPAQLQLLQAGLQPMEDECTRHGIALIWPTFIPALVTLDSSEDENDLEEAE